MAPEMTLHSPVRSCAASIISEMYDYSDTASDYQPAAVAVQPRRRFQNQIQLLETKARLTSIRSSTVSAVPSTMSQGPGPTLPTSPASLDLFPNLRSKPSSVLLGEECVEKSQLGTSSQSKTLRGQESSSTLHSFYDSQKLPLVVSQQTSDSSSRDFALRKDCPAVVTPESQRRRHFFESSKSRPKSKEDKHGRDRTDLSALFPKPGTSNRRSIRRSENPPYYKMHVKRPKAGTKHWFDSYGDEVSDEEGITTAEFEPAMPPEFAEGLGNAFMNFSSENPPTYEQPLRQMTPPRSMPRTSETSKINRLLGIGVPYLTQRTPIHTSHGTRAPSIPTPRATPKAASVNSMQTANLKEQSVLFLSSDDEDEAPELPNHGTHRPATRMTGGLRDSLAVSNLDDTEIEVGEAKTVRSQPAVLVHKPLSQNDMEKPHSDPGNSKRTRVVVVPDRRSSRMGAYFAEPSPIMDERKPSRSLSSNSNGIAGVLSGATQAELSQGSIRSLPFEKPEDGPRVISWDATESSQSTLQRRASTRLMPVTRQEQALLAAMRSKKATMRRNSVHQEDSEPWQDEMNRDSDYAHRPRTSAETNAPAFVELGSNNYADWISRRRSSAVANQYDGARASVTTFATGSQRASTRLSRYPSDDSPDTSASTATSLRDSVLLQRNSPGLGTRFSLSSSGYLGHSRSRTDSSHIVVLDDLNDSPKDMENRPTSPGYPSWAYNGWTESPEIAAVR